MAWRHQVLRLLIQRAADRDIAEAAKASLNTKLTAQAEEIHSKQLSIEELNLKLTAKEAAFEALTNKSEVSLIALF